MDARLALRYGWGMKRFSQVLTVAFVVLVIWALRHIHLREMAAVVAGAQVSWLLFAIALQMLVVFLWAVLWRQFAPATASFVRVFQSTALASAAFAILPAVAAQASSLTIVMRRCQLTIKDAASLVAGEQISEATGKAVLIGIALFVAPLSIELRRAAYLTILILFGAVIAAVAVALWWKKTPQVFRQRGVFARGVAAALLIKTIEGFALFAAQRSLGVDLGAPGVILVLAIGALGSMATTVTVLPGPIGISEALTATAYTQLGLPLERAVALVAVQTTAVLIARFTLAGSVYASSTNRSLQLQ